MEEKWIASVLFACWGHRFLMLAAQTPAGDFSEWSHAPKHHFTKQTTVSHQTASINQEANETAQSVPQEGLEINSVDGEAEPPKRWASCCAAARPGMYIVNRGIYTGNR